MDRVRTVAVICVNTSPYTDISLGKGYFAVDNMDGTYTLEDDNGTQATYPEWRFVEC